MDERVIEQVTDRKQRAQTAKPVVIERGVPNWKKAIMQVADYIEQVLKREEDTQ